MLMYYSYTKCVLEKKRSFTQADNVIFFKVAKQERLRVFVSTFLSPPSLEVI